MNCYKCGNRLSEKNFCTGCNTDVTRYKQIIFLSNSYYNQGLEKAQVRDLSGAVECLKQSLKLNKNNTPARNLLGLVYFELGDTVEALAEWVISKNYQGEKNIADDYISALQSNPGLLDNINQAIKKYNLGLNYCHDGSYDLAKIQLRKVVNMNPKFIRARLLLALLLIKEEEWKKAKKELDACKKIDCGNVMTNRLLKETDEMLGLEDNGLGLKMGKQSENATWSVSGNETIIQPNLGKESGGFGIILNIVIGLVIGLIIGWFLLAPIKVKMQKDSYGDELTEVREQLEIKTSTVEELQQKVDALTKEKENLNENLQNYEGSNGANEYQKILMLAAIEYNKGSAANKLVVADYLNQLDINYVENEAGEEYLMLYNQLKEFVGENVSADYYAAGYEAYKNQDYDLAIEKLTSAVFYDPTNCEAIYALASAYFDSGDFVNARENFERIIELQPDSERAEKAQSYITQMDEFQ